MAQQFPVKKVLANTSLGEFEAADFVGIDDGGTGATNAPSALANLGAAADADLTAHENDVANPHAVTAAQVGAIPTAQKGVANGVATLDVGGKVPVSQIPATALPEVHVVLDEAARLALTVQEGDEAIQLDDGTHWIYDGTFWWERPQPATFPLQIQDDGSPLTLEAKVINFKGFTVTEPLTDEITVETVVPPITLQVNGNSKETAYKIIGQSIWGGSILSGVPSAIKANAYVDGAADLGAIKLYDATNALTIAEITGITATDLDSILDLGVLSNISTGEAVWEWQGLQVPDDKNSQLDIESVVIYL
jgi:hypothetical protein